MASINHNNAKNQNNDNSNIITLIAVLPKHFTYINLWDPYNNPMRWTLFLSFSLQINWDMEKLSDFPEFT